MVEIVDEGVDCCWGLKCVFPVGGEELFGCWWFGVGVVVRFDEEEDCDE